MPKPFVVEELKAVFDPRGGQWMDGRYVPSLLAALGEAAAVVGGLDGAAAGGEHDTRAPRQLVDHLGRLHSAVDQVAHVQRERQCAGVRHGHGPAALAVFLGNRRC